MSGTDIYNKFYLDANKMKLTDVDAYVKYRRDWSFGVSSKYPSQIFSGYLDYSHDSKFLFPCWIFKYRIRAYNHPNKLRKSGLGTYLTLYALYLHSVSDNISI